MKSKTAWIVLTVIITVGLIWINTYRRSVRYFNEAQDLMADGKILDAVTSYEIAAHAYTPWNTYVQRSMERLWEIGQRLEKEKEDPAYALIAYRSLRSSVFAIRSFYMPYREWIPRCDEKIRLLVLKQKQQMAAQAAPTPEI
ncbi:hypothetical protein JXA40_05465 [bacterium]|nr:hypothetical protein [candidate division CSSED10-310 bacterium]